MKIKTAYLRVGASVLFGVLALCAFVPGAVAAVEVGEMTGILHAVASAACPPDGAVGRQDYLTDDLQGYQALAQVDTASTCGSCTGLATLTTEIYDGTISAVMTAVTSLEGHRSSLGSSYFHLEFEVTVPTDYTLSMVGTSSFDHEPGVMGLSLRLRGIHEIQQNNPEFSEDYSGTLAPGRYVLDGSCSNSRSAYDIGGEWVFESGNSGLTGALNLTFSDAVVVETERQSLGSLKALFR